MGEEVEQGIIKSVQRHVESIVRRLCLNAAGQRIEVYRMGSREYDCAVKSSDLDLYLTVSYTHLRAHETLR